MSPIQSSQTQNSQTQNKKFQNKIALVSGGSRGIGAAIVKQLASEGATVAFTYVNGKESADKVASSIEKAGGKALAIRADSVDSQSIEAAVNHVAKTFGKLDILVNNAGVFIGDPIESLEVKTADIEKQFAINVSAVATAVRAAAPHLKEGGRVINIGSVFGDKSPLSGIAAYSASKAAVAAYSRGWARDLGARGITVNTIQPGPIATEMNPETGPLADALIPSIALKRYGKAEEVAAVVSFLASPEASYITGTTLNIDGGFLA